MISTHNPLRTSPSNRIDASKSLDDALTPSSPASFNSSPTSTTTATAKYATSTFTFFNNKENIDPYTQQARSRAQNPIPGTLSTLRPALADITPELVKKTLDAANEERGSIFGMKKKLAALKVACDKDRENQGPPTVRGSVKKCFVLQNDTILKTAKTSGSSETRQKKKKTRHKKVFGQRRFGQQSSSLSACR